MMMMMVVVVLCVSKMGASSEHKGNQRIVFCMEV